MPFFLQVGTSSSGSIGREASEMSVSPAQNFSKPPPVPDSPTVTLTPGFSPWKPSAAAWANGKTVLEPSIVIGTGEVSAATAARELLSSPPQPAAPMRQCAAREHGEPCDSS